MAATKKHRLYWTDEKVLAMHAEYLAGALFTEIGRKWGCRNSSVRNAFKSRGLQLLDRRNVGRFVKTRDTHTVAEIRAIVAQLDSVHVPRALQYEWRRWGLHKRRWFLGLVKAKRPPEKRMSDLPCSANVTRFDYCTVEARAICAAVNQGKDSRSAGQKMNLCSEGVIFEGRLWFWNGKLGRFVAGPYSVATGRREALHWHIYERHHGPIPPDGVVSHRDGNPNNLDPANLYLRSKNDICRENQHAALNRKAAQRLDAILNRHTHSLTTP